MKKSIVFLLILWLTQTIYAEGDRHRMLVSGRTWNYMSFYDNDNIVIDTVYHSISIDGPVEFDGKRCYKFANKTLEEAKNFFYEEGGKVYFYGIDYDKDEYAWIEEFNFDLKTGEKEVLSVDSVCVNGEYYRRLKLMNDVWIEGIGSLESGILSDWGETPGTFLGSKVISVYDGEHCIFTTEDFTKPSITDAVMPIEIPYHNGASTQPYYDLQGRPQQYPRGKSVYIRQGRKVVR